MQEGILNERVRDCGTALLEAFGDQMRLPFKALLFVAVDEEGNFRTGNMTESVPLTAEAVKMIAKHLSDWADLYSND